MYDYERYLTLLNYPEPNRRFGMALASFNIEVAQVSTRSVKSDMAKLRYAYFKDVINAVFQKGVKYSSPLELELAKAISLLEHRLSKTWFLQLITAREEYPLSFVHPSCEALEQYFDLSRSSLNYLMAESFGLTNMEVDAMLSHIGRAQGYCDFIRSIGPLARQQRLVPMPLDLLANHNVSQEVIVRHCAGSHQNASTSQLQDLGYELGDRAYGHFKLAVESAQSLLQKENQQPIAYLCLSLLPVRRFLRDFRARALFDIGSIHLQRRYGFLPLELWWYTKRSRICSPEI